MAMLHFPPVDPCDLRCAMMRMRVCKMYYAGARVGNYCVFEGLGDLPWPYYILDLLIPAICDACARM